MKKKKEYKIHIVIKNIDSMKIIVIIECKMFLEI